MIMSSQSLFEAFQVSEASVSPVQVALPGTTLNNLHTTSLASMEEPSEITAEGNASISFQNPPSPPQASVLRQMPAPFLRAATPTDSGLSSPPPTVVNNMQKPWALNLTFIKTTPQELAEASQEDLVKMLKASFAENDRLDVAAKEARMSVAHYKLQHNLLSIETEEARKRMEVEHEMTRREVSILQHATQDRIDAPNPEFISKIRFYCESLEDENTKLLRRLKHAKKLLECQEDEIERLKEKSEQFKQRIRENREHLNTLRSPGGIFYSPSPKTFSHDYPATPQQYQPTPKHTPMTARSARQVRTHSQEPFAALLLADRVLSQENNSEPATPNVNRRTELPSTPGNKHTRAVLSLSSVPRTPGVFRPGNSNSTLLPSIQFTPHVENRLSRPTPGERRSKSRDSTISASDSEEMARYRGESEELQESQASQSATQMLRIDPRESSEVAACGTRTPTPITEKSSLLQSKILGSVTKLAMEKRKRVSGGYSHGHSAKKTRTDDSVGLGIGFTAGRG